MERVRYEYFRKKLERVNVPTQELTVPIVHEIRADLMLRLPEINQSVASIGLEFQAIGPNQVALRQVPVWMHDVDEYVLIRQILDLFEEERTISLEKLRKHAAATMACHSSIRFNRVLTEDEMRSLIEQLAQCEQPYHCPHGRPTFLSIKDQTLDKDFGR